MYLRVKIPRKATLGIEEQYGLSISVIEIQKNHPCTETFAPPAFVVVAGVTFEDGSAVFVASSLQTAGAFLVRGIVRIAEHLL